MTNYNDKDITFFIQINNKDRVVVTHTIDQIKNIYPQSRIIVCCDGIDVRFTYDNVEIIIGKSLMGHHNGGKAIHRMLCAWAMTPTKYLIKLDWNTYIEDRISLPDPSIGIIFGTYNNYFNDNKLVLHSGCIGFTAPAIWKLLSKRMLLHKKLKAFKRLPSEYSIPIRYLVNQTLETSFDFCIGWAAMILKIPLVEHSEIYSSSFHSDLSNNNQKIIHPYVFWESDKKTEFKCDIYCLNLERAVDRKKSMHYLWNEKLGYDINFIKAYDRRSYEIDDSDITKVVPLENPYGFIRSMTSGEICVAYSHYRILNNLIESNSIGEEGVIIFEDDAMPGPSAYNLFYELELAKNELPELEIINLGFHYIIRRDTKIGFDGEHVEQTLIPPWGTEAIWYSLEGAIKMRSFFSMLSVPSDHYDKIAKTGIVGRLKRPAVIHNDDTSYVNRPYEARDYID